MTITPATYREYHAKRREDPFRGAAHTLALVRHEREIRDLPCMVGDSYTTEDGLTVALEAEPDCVSLDDALGDGFGRFAHGAPESHDPDAVSADFYRAGWHYRRKGATAERLAWYRHHGMARGPAWLRARQELEREAATCDRLINDGWFTVVVTTTDGDGNVMGEESLGCVEFGWIEGVLVGYGLIDEALGCARKTLADKQAREAADLEHTRPDLYATA